MVGELGRAGGDAREVAVPEADELQRLVERAGGGAALGALRLLAELPLAALVLLLGQEGELLGERRLDALARGAAALARRS